MTTKRTGLLALIFLLLTSFTSASRAETPATHAGGAGAEAAKPREEGLSFQEELAQCKSQKTDLATKLKNQRFVCLADCIMWDKNFIGAYGQERQRFIARAATSDEGIKQIERLCEKQATISKKQQHFPVSAGGSGIGTVMIRANSQSSCTDFGE